MPQAGLSQSSKMHTTLSAVIPLTPRRPRPSVAPFRDCFGADSSHTASPLWKRHQMFAAGTADLIESWRRRCNFQCARICPACDAEEIAIRHQDVPGRLSLCSTECDVGHARAHGGVGSDLPSSNSGVE